MGYSLKLPPKYRSLGKSAGRVAESGYWRETMRELPRSEYVFQSHIDGAIWYTGRLLKVIWYMADGSMEITDLDDPRVPLPSWRSLVLPPILEE